MLETPEYSIKQSRGPLSKFDYDLFDEEQSIVKSIIRVKRFVKGKVEKWKIFLDTKQVLIIHGSSINKKEKDFLRTSEGMNCLLQAFKNGITTVVKMKAYIKLEISKSSCHI